MNLTDQQIILCAVVIYLGCCAVSLGALIECAEGDIKDEKEEIAAGPLIFFSIVWPFTWLMYLGAFMAEKMR